MIKNPSLSNNVALSSPPPGLMISAPASGTGKTTVMLGLLRALSDKGHIIQPFKSGPDYIDPAFHKAAAHRPSYNLDSWAMDENLLDAIHARAEGANFCLAEGSMGLYDCVATKGRTGYGASAEIAVRMGWPVVLVLDVGGQAQSAAATALGFARYRPDLPFAGVILNRVASPRHSRLIRLGMEAVGIPVLGALPRRGDLALPERHLGLIQAKEHPDLERAITDYAAFLRDNCDLEAICAAAAARPHPAQADTTQSAPQSGTPTQPKAHARQALPAHALPPLPRPPAQRIALARDAAFSFTYPHLLEGWHAAGAEIIPFSPLEDEAPAPHADLIWLPGGYPELHAPRLAAAQRFRAGLHAHARKGRPIHGECGGYMALGAGLIAKDGLRYEMAGLLGLVTSYAARKFHLGYRRAILSQPMPGYAPGAALRGHEFHYSTILEQPDSPLAQVFDADGQQVSETGSYRGSVTGTFFHLIAGED